MKKAFAFIIVTLLYFSVLSQNIGSKVSFVAVDGKTYTGIINDILGNSYKIKYDGFDHESWLLNTQFNVLNTSSKVNYEQAAQANNTIHSKVIIRGADGKTYTGTIREIRGNKYRVKYEGYDFEPWLLQTQFTGLNKSATPVYSPIDKQQTTDRPSNNAGGAQDIFTIFSFGKRAGWTSQIQENKLKDYLAQLPAQDKTNLIRFIKGAKTNSAKFFVLESLLAGDDFTVLQNFIDELNQYPESYQQERCLVITRKSIIQQWQYSCSVTAVQTF